MDPDGRKVTIYITGSKSGEGYLRSDPQGNSILISVPLYSVYLFDSDSNTASFYQVSRHSALNQDDYWVSSFEEMSTYQPEGEKSSFVGVISKKDYGLAIELRNPKRPELRGDLYRADNGDPNTATIEIHVGGSWIEPDGQNHNVTSFGCFSVQGANSGKRGFDIFLEDLNKRLSLSSDKTIYIEVYASEN